MLGDLDTWLCIIDIVICLVDIGLIVYLFFYRLPHEQKRKPFRSRIRRSSAPSRTARRTR